MSSSSSNGTPWFDEKLAASYVGKYIIVGITRCDHNDREIGRQQLHGIIESASPTGINIALRGVRDGQYWNMPPALEAIRPAEPGRYHLHSTGEVIEDPDLTATWTIKEPPPKH